MDIIREPSKDETYGDVTDETSKAFIPLQTPQGRIKSPSDKFAETISKYQQVAIKKGLPFADAAARADLKDIQDELLKRWSRQGYVNKEELPKINWDKYSDLKNFEIIESDYKRDSGLSKEHKVAVNVKFVKYVYKGFSNTYTVMEDPTVSLTRALDTLESRKVRSTK
jgi:hypothetical protein